MKAIELPFEVKSNALRIILLIFIISWMSVYPIYTAYYKANAVETYERYKEHMAGHSMFFNPWQYRVLCPMVIEGIYQVLDHTVYPLLNIQGIHLSMQGNVTDKNATTQKLVTLLQDPQFIKYTIVFLGFRFLEGVLLLLLAYRYLSMFVRSVGLRWLALSFITLFIGNGVVDSDLTFNTYMDVILYLWAGIVIINNKSYWWILLITVIGALNRETSVFIPALFFFSRVNWTFWPNIWKVALSDRTALIVTASSAVVFVSIFVAIRMYYGYESQSTWRVAAGWPMLKLNLFSSASIKTYMEHFGVYAFFPIWALFVLGKSDVRLKVFFFSLVPAWFALHISSAIGFQTRLFLVPTLMVIIPIVFEYLDRREKGIS